MYATYTRIVDTKIFSVRTKEEKYTTESQLISQPSEDELKKKMK